MDEISVQGYVVLDLDAPMVGGLPDATPKPGELAREVVQIGYLSGLLHSRYDRKRREKRAYVDSSFLNDQVLRLELNSRPLQEVRVTVRPLRQEDSQWNFVRYIEDFIQGCEERRGELKQLYSAVSQARNDLPHPIGLGLLGVHFYYED